MCGTLGIEGLGGGGVGSGRLDSGEAMPSCYARKIRGATRAARVVHDSAAFGIWCGSDERGFDNLAADDAAVEELLRKPERRPQRFSSRF